MDTQVHYIFSGCYCATVDNSGQQQWSLVMGVRDNDSAKIKKLILSKEATPEATEFLTSTIRSKAPLVSSAILEDKEETSRYFSRRTFRGAIVGVNRVNEGEWVCLMGDAAHSVLPPVGEGMNSGLEDTVIFHQCLQSSEVFAEYNRRRLPDLQALHEYATYLNEIPWFSGERASRGVFLATNGLCTSQTISNLLFGPLAGQRLPYRDIIGKWKCQKLFILSFIRLLIYPIAFAIEVVFLPLTLIKCINRAVSGPSEPLDTSIKPPVGDADAKVCSLQRTLS